MASGGKFAYPDDAEETPETLTTVFEFNGFNIQWEHATGINDGPYQRDHGVALIGNNGTLIVDRGGWEVIPEVINGSKKMDEVKRQRAVDNGLDLHTKNFLEVIESQKLDDLHCPVNVAAHVATVCQMGNIAFRTGRKVYWDEEKRKFTDQQRQIHNIKEDLFPKNGLQERIDNFMYYYAKWGKDFIRQLYQHSLALDQEFVIVEEK